MRPRAPRFGASQAAKQRHAAYRSRKHSGDTPITVSAISGTQPLWPCLSSSIAVVVMPLRNLTGDPDWQSLAEAFTEHLVSHLHRHGRAFSLHQAVDQPGAARNGAGPAGPQTGYIVDGSIQRGYSGMFRVNMRINDAAT